MEMVSVSDAMNKWKQVVPDINPPSTWIEAKTAYRKGALKHHPDKNQGNGESFKILNEAYEFLQESHNLSNIDQILSIWKRQWSGNWWGNSSYAQNMPLPFFATAPPVAEQTEMDHALLRSQLRKLDEQVTDAQKTGKAFQVMDKLKQRLQDPRFRSTTFFVWRAVLNSSHDLAYTNQAKVMQDMCSTWDMAAKLVDLALEHPSILATEHENIMDDKNWDKVLSELFIERIKGSRSVYDKYNFKEKIKSCADMLFRLVNMFPYSFTYLLMKLEHKEEIEYRIKPMAQFEFVCQYKKKEQEEDEGAFSKETRARFAKEREDLLNSEPIDYVEVVENNQELNRQKTEVDVLTNQLVVLQKTEENEGQLRTEEKAHLEARLQYVRKSEMHVIVALPDASHKRKHSQLMDTPIVQVNHIQSLVKSMFHFVVHLERKCDRFFVKHALQHGYMREAETSGNVEFDIDDADVKSKSRMRSLDLSEANPTEELVGNSKKKTFAAVEYLQLCDLLLQEFGWFRSIYTTLVGHVLPTPELQAAIIGYLVEIQAEVTCPVVQAILGVEQSVASHIVKQVELQLPEQQQISREKSLQCVHIIARQNSQCKKFGKVGQTVPLCSYHKARRSIPSLALRADAPSRPVLDMATIAYIFKLRTEKEYLKEIPLLIEDMSAGPSSVYVIGIRGSELVKIGRSRNPTTRKSQLQTGNPFPLDLRFAFQTTQPVKLEKQVHKDLSHNKVLGEWFLLPMDADYGMIIKRAERKLNG